MKVYQVQFDEERSQGVYAISLVDSPAIEYDFVAMSKDENFPMQLKTVDEEKRIVTGAVLVPNKAIYRKQGDEEFYIYFPSETITKLAHTYLKRGRQGEVTLQHQLRIEGVTLVESWIVDNSNNDKLANLGLKVPDGSWAGTMKIDNDEIWNEFVKTGQLQGFSIEGFFNLKDTGTELEIEASKTPKSADEVLEAIYDVLSDYEATTK